jgi:hypothetical protein
MRDEGGWQAVAAVSVREAHNELRLLQYAPSTHLVSYSLMHFDLWLSQFKPVMLESSGAVIATAMVAIACKASSAGTTSCSGCGNH